MRLLYIGQYTKGSTSKMRADSLSGILGAWKMEIIDTNIPFYDTSKVFRSLGFRLQIGMLIKNINSYILAQLGNSYDLIWVDKGIFIEQKTTKILKKRTKYLLHYTPDAAFVINKSKHFEKSINLYDFVISTKTYELNLYLKYIPKEKLIYATQGFQKDIHKTSIPFQDKKNAVLFIGRHEKNREEMLQLLVNQGIKVSVSGNNWQHFVEHNSENNFVTWLGTGLFDAQYAKTISSYKIAWGALSKLMPEKHTTRTFEIPACGTALITERNSELETFFNDREVIFYSTENEFVEKIKYFLAHLKELELITKKGNIKTTMGGFDYDSILKKILTEVNILS